MKFVAFALACLVTFVITVSTVTSDTHGSTIFLVVVLAGLTLWSNITVLASVVSHLDDLSRVHRGKAGIATAETRLEKVRALAADQTGLPEQLLALQQDDNPVTKYMGLVDSALRNLENEQNYTQRAQASIAARKAGPLSCVVTWFGDAIE